MEGKSDLLCGRIDLVDPALDAVQEIHRLARVARVAQVADRQDAALADLADEHGIDRGVELVHAADDLPEGDLTRIRAALVCENSLVDVAKELDLGSYLKLGKGEESGGGRHRPSIQADAVEAMLAAVYLDGGIGQARKLIHDLILGHEREKTAAGRDYKTALQELVQRESGQVLTYHLTGESGPDHAKIFAMEVLLNGQAIGAGTGHSKKEAEQAAAKAAVEKMGHE